MQKRSRVRGNDSGWPVDEAKAIYGITIQPKIKMAIVVGEGYITRRLSIYSDRLNRVTDGWYQEYYDDSYSKSEDTGYPRAHVGTDSSRPLGAGWGSALYNGLCIGARVRDLGARLPAMRIQGSGISSSEGSRTEGSEHTADKWWESAVAAGFAYETEITVETEPETFEITPRSSSRRGERHYYAIVEAINDYLESAHQIYDANWSMPEISGTYGAGEKEILANVLPFEPEYRATGISKLVLCTFKNAPRITRDGFSDLSWLTEDEVSDFEPDVLRALNLSEASPEVIGLIRRVAEVMGATGVLEDNETLPRSVEARENRRRRNGASAERQAAERRMRLDAWADLDD